LRGEDRRTDRTQRGFDRAQVRVATDVGGYEDRADAHAVDTVAIAVGETIVRGVRRLIGRTQMVAR
jgi:hypothetical protein